MSNDLPFIIMEKEIVLAICEHKEHKSHFKMCFLSHTAYLCASQ